MVIEGRAGGRFLCGIGSKSMNGQRIVFVFALFWGGAPSATAQPSCYGPGDLDTNGAVDLNDHAIVAGCLSGPGMGTPPAGCGPASFARGDLDFDGDLDLNNFGLFVLAYQNRYFDYGPRRDNLEAELLAMDVSGQLRAPDGEYDRLLGDLQLIRFEYPQLLTVIDDPDYVPNELVVSLVDGEPLDEYAALNDYYMVTDEEWLFSTWWVLTFCDNLNAVPLGPIYEALPAVEHADPNWYYGHDDYITVTVIGTTYRYDIDDGFLDCFDGCDCHRQWAIDVDEFGTVTLVSYNEWGMSWCEF
jgi:hypothetical protein